MTNVQVTEQSSTESGWEFTVHTDVGTEHTVVVPRDYYQKLTGKNISPRQLVKDSFTFLLERESADAILAEFTLSEIEDYFSEYPRVIRNSSNL